MKCQHTNREKTETHFGKLKDGTTGEKYHKFFCKDCGLIFLEFIKEDI